MKTLLISLIVSLATQAWALDLNKAVVVSPPGFSGPENKAVTVLVEEVEKRTRILWPIEHARPTSAVPVISIERGSGPAEGYTIRAESGNVTISGNDARGVLFGVGRLLREMRMDRDSVWLPDGYHITTAPKYPLRGHQLGYRPKTNAYDGFSVAMWDQYIRDLAVFGTNAIELIPPRSDDAADSPHFPLPPMQMMVEMSRIADEYGLDVWVWYPAMDKDYSNPQTVEHAVREWGEVFRKLPRINDVFVPGGDPGHTAPKYLMALLEKETQELHKYHPKARMWVSPQGFSKEWMDEFLDILNQQQPSWLGGVVFGPQSRLSLPEMRARVPKKYPIRLYPDITHSRQCQYPVPDWDVAYAMSEGREIANPRPTQEARIFHLLVPYTVGFLTYSEGINDDVNKFVWSALGWDPNEKVIDILREYSRYFIGDRFADGFAQGLLSLERNWEGPLLTNENVDTTLKQFQAMEREATPSQLHDWRFLQALYRANTDAYERSRLIYETELEQRAMDILRDAKDLGSVLAMSRAQSVLDRAVTHRVAQDWRSRAFVLAEALFQTIHAQLSVPLYKAIAVDRGASLDTIDVPLNDRLWLGDQFAEIRKVPDESERLKRIHEIVHWTDPGPGGFYDDLGDLTRQPHLVRGPGFEKDPEFRYSALVGFGTRDHYRMSWWDQAESLFDAPLRMHYSNLDPHAHYKIRVVYAGDSISRDIRLVAGENIQIHPLLKKPVPIRPLEFDIPQQAIRNGELDLRWYRQAGLGGNGRGAQVSEVWLIRK